MFSSLLQGDSCDRAPHAFSLFIHDVFSESLLCATNAILGARDIILSQKETSIISLH